MELAQALILTNALGGLSSLGRHQGQTSNGGLMALREGYYVEVVCQTDQIDVYVFAEDSQTPTDQPLSSSLRSLTGAAMLPGRLLLRSPQGQLAFPLHTNGDHLAADVMYPDDSFEVAVELVVKDQLARTGFTTLQPPLPDEA